MIVRVAVSNCCVGCSCSQQLTESHLRQLPPSFPSSTMKLPLGLAALILATIPTSCALRRPVKREYPTHDYYVLEHNPTVGSPLTDVLDVLGLELVEKAGELENFWVLRTPKSIALERRGAIDILEDLKRRANTNIFPRSPDSLKARQLASSIKYLSLQKPRQRIKRDDSHLWLRQEPAETTNATSRDVAERLHITDPSFGSQWHLVNDDFPEHMVDVVPVWDMNITGEGIIAAMVDDGVDYESDDLADNFVSGPLLYVAPHWLTILYTG